MSEKKIDYQKLYSPLKNFICSSHQDYQLVYAYLDDVLKNLKTYKKHVLVAKISILHGMLSENITRSAELVNNLELLQLCEQCNQEQKPLVMLGQTPIVS